MAREAALPIHHPTDRLVGHTPAIQALRAQIRHLAAFDAVGNPYAPTVLLQGETGTGKGLVARISHDSGLRAPGPFLDVNCAAMGLGSQAVRTSHTQPVRALQKRASAHERCRGGRTDRPRRHHSNRTIRQPRQLAEPHRSPPPIGRRSR
jgi:hypothetical protein